MLYKKTHDELQYINLYSQLYKLKSYRTQLDDHLLFLVDKLGGNTTDITANTICMASDGLHLPCLKTKEKVLETIFFLMKKGKSYSNTVTLEHIRQETKKS